MNADRPRARLLTSHEAAVLANGMRLFRPLPLRFVGCALLVQREDEVGRGGSIVGSPEDLVLILLESRYPRADVSGMIRGIVRNAEFGRQEHARQPGAKLLFG